MVWSKPSQTVFSLVPICYDASRAGFNRRVKIQYRTRLAHTTSTVLYSYSSARVFQSMVEMADIAVGSIHLLKRWSCADGSMFIIIFLLQVATNNTIYD